MKNSRFLKTVFALSCVLFLMVNTFGFNQTFAWYDNSWSYRKSHIINSATGAGTDYQIKLTVHYGSGTDSADEVYLGGKGNADFSDLRFTSSDGETLLPYWIQSKTDSDNAVVWVKISDDISSSSATIYVYYGNSSATSASNGENTFIFFDDFDGSSVDSSKWDEVNTGAGSVTISGGTVTILSNGDWWGTSDASRYLVSKSSMGTNYATEAFVVQSGVGDGYARFFGLRSGAAPSEKQFVLLGDSDHSHITNVYRLAVWGGASWFGNNTGTIDTGVNKIARFEVNGDNVKSYYDDSLANNMTVSDWNLGYIALTDTNGSNPSEFDWIFSRKYVDPEPTNGTWGAEEDLSSLVSSRMNSSNYRIITDSLNSGGLEGSVSSNYGLVDTLGEVGTGESSSSNYKIRAGYRQLQDGYISITAEPDETISSIGGLTGGESTANSVWTVTTDNLSGYELDVRVTTDPALKSGPYSFADYSPSGPAPDFNFTYGSTESVFGFSPEGVDILQRYKDNGSACNAGSSDTSLRCWDGFSTTDTTVSRSYSSNHPDGEETTLQYQVGIGSERNQEGGDYSAEIIVTATAL